MKKIAAILLAMMLLMLPALAMKGEGYPGFDGRQEIKDGMGGQFGDENLLLAFDSGANYSYLRDGYIQGCFFAFDAAEEYYLELYMLLPEKIQAGDVLTPESSFAAGAASCSITLFEVDEQNNEQAWFAGQMMGKAYPENSSFSITIDQADYTEETVSVRGKIEAQMCMLENDKPSEELMPLNADFSFVLPLKNEPAPSASPAPKIQNEIPMPAPAFTLPPDHISL